MHAPNTGDLSEFVIIQTLFKQSAKLPEGRVCAVLSRVAKQQMT